MSDIAAIRSSLSQIKVRHQLEVSQGESIKAELATLEADKAQLLKAVMVIDKAIQIISSNGVQRIEDTVTNGLSLVFPGQDLSIKIIKKEGARGNSYSIEGSQGEDIHGPILDTFGGSVANVVSFLLRIIMIKRFNLAPYLIADESFGNVAAVYLPMVSQLLRTLCESGFTILAITHAPLLAEQAHHVYQGTMDGPTSEPFLYQRR